MWYFTALTCQARKVRTATSSTAAPTDAAAPHLACVLVDHVEHGVLAGVPVDPLTQSFPSQFACDDLQKVHLDGLLNKHHVVLRHGWKQKNEVTGGRSQRGRYRREAGSPKLW